MAGKSGAGRRPVKQLRTNNPVSKKELMPRLVGSTSKKDARPALVGAKPKRNYLSNAVKEVKEYGKAYKKADKASLSVTPGANARARAANKNEKAQMGQALGAVLQGRRYTNTGKQIKGK